MAMHSHHRIDSYTFRVARGAAWGVTLGGAFWLLLGLLLWLA